MSKKRGKNRPPRLGPPQEKPKPILVRPCTNCFRIVDIAELSGPTGECQRCWRFRLEG